MASKQTKNSDMAALYARYSSDLQSAASIDDQLRMYQERAAKEGWQVVERYFDQAISGASLIRPGIQKLLQDAAAGKFDIIVTESLDRLARDQEDIVHIYKRMLFQGVGIVTLFEGEGSREPWGRSTSRNVPSCRSLPDPGGPKRAPTVDLGALH